MSENEQRELFCRNLNRIMQERNLTQVEVASAINVSPQTFNTWINGKAIPRMGKIQALADYFKIPKSALIEERPARPSREQLLQDIYDKHRILFDAAEDATEAEIQAAVDYINYLKEKR